MCFGDKENSFLLWNSPFNYSDISNNCHPKELAHRLIEDEVKLIENNGADRGTKHFLV